MLTKSDNSIASYPGSETDFATSFPRLFRQRSHFQELVAQRRSTPTNRLQWPPTHHPPSAYSSDSAPFRFGVLIGHCYLPLATISVISSACSSGLNCCTSPKMPSKTSPADCC